MKALAYVALGIACWSCTVIGPHRGGRSDEDNAPDGPDAGTATGSADAAIDAPPTLPASQGQYRGTCDGSSGIALDATHFVGFSDNDQRARVFAYGQASAPLASIDLNATLQLGSEADFEDAARIGDRIFVTGSHGRKNDGTLDRSRYRFVALDITGTAPAVGLTVAGVTTRLFDDMLDPANWTAPDNAILDALTKASQLGTSKVANLAPKVDGVNIEGLARAPTTDTPERLVLGLRNPRPNGRAIVATLMNPNAVIAGAAARFGQAFALDLGGLGIRAMAWSEPLGAVLLIAGPRDDATAPFRLYRWSANATAPSFVTELAPGGGAKPEAIITYPTMKDVQILLDSDDVAVGGTSCDNANSNDRVYRDMIIHIE